MAREDGSGLLTGPIVGRIAEYLVNANVANRQRLGPHMVRLGMMMQEEFFRLTGAEVNRTIGPFFGMVAEHPDAPIWLRDTAGFVSAGKGQWATLLAGTATGAAMGGGLLALISNEMQPVIGALIRANPHMPFAPADASAAVARGLLNRFGGMSDAGQAGLDENRFDILVQMNTTVLAPGEILELFLRGDIGETEARMYFHRTGFDGHHAGVLMKLARRHLSLPEASQMWNRSIIDDAELIDVGRRNGYSREDSLRYRELGGEPPSPEILYTAFRRGFIDRDRLQRGIVQGPTRNEWFDVLEKLQFHSMTPEQAGSAITQGHMTLQRGQAIAQEYGLNPDDFATIVETSGRPPGIEFADEAFNRGFISDDEYGAMFLESAIKNKYLPILRSMRTRLMPQETARSLLAKGVMTVERCTEILASHGYSPEDVASFIDAATMEKTTTQRDLSLSATLELYTEQEITAETATQMILALGYDDQESAWLLGLADLRRLRTFRNAVITRVRAAFVKGFIDDSGASSALDSLEIPATRRDSLIQLWMIERQTVTKDLTPAQIVAAAKKSLMPVAAALSRLIGQGYDSGDAQILLASAGVQVGGP